MPEMFNSMFPFLLADWLGLPGPGPSILLGALYALSDAAALGVGVAFLTTRGLRRLTELPHGDSTEQ